jgi:[acyl-carrier-protein] S-malonyltransferase
MPGPVVAFAGHSLGEISALVCADALPVGAAVRLVQRRAELMASVTGGASAVVFGIRAASVKAVCGEISAAGRVVTIANRNSADQTVISGHASAVASARDALVRRGAVVVPLRIGVPVHSPLMADVVPMMDEAIGEISLNDPNVPVVSAVSGQACTTAEEVRNMLRAQLTNCVDWPAAMADITSRHIDVVVEVGPKSVLRDLVRLSHPELVAVSCGTVEQIAALSGIFATVTAGPVPQSAADQFLANCLRVAVGTPSRNTLQGKRFAETVQAPYENIRLQLDKLREPVARSVDPAVVRDAARALLGILRAKGIDADNRARLLRSAAQRAGLSHHVAEFLS